MSISRAADTWPWCLCRSSGFWYFCLLSSSASMGPHIEVFPDHMRMLFTGVPLKVQGGDRCCCLYVAVNTVNVFWRWQVLLLPFREYVENFFACSDCLWEQILVGKRLRQVSEMMGKHIPRLTGSKVDVSTTALDSLSETVRVSTLVHEY